MRTLFWNKPLLALLLLFVAPLLARAQSDDETRRAWNRPVTPFRVIDNIYYVGVAGITSFLITTPEGHILLDSGLEETVPIIQDNLRQLGFELKDVKVLLNSHAHFDHAGGFAHLKTLTGAQLMISEGDAPLIEGGGRDGVHQDGLATFEPASVDRLLRDNDTVALGGVTMTARITPGHTKGCTTWTMAVEDGGTTYDVVFVGGTTVAANRLVKDPTYPGIVDDYVYTFDLMKSLNGEVFLAGHGFFFALEEKMQRLEEGTAENPFIDPEGYRRLLERHEQAFRRRLQAERKEAGGGE